MQVRYEAMFLLKPDITQEKHQEVFDQISEPIIKNQGKVISKDIWSEKRKLTYPIKKQKEAIYYLVQFNSESKAIEKLRQLYALNDNILRILFLKLNSGGS